MRALRLALVPEPRLVGLRELIGCEAVERTDESFPDGSEHVEVGERAPQLREPILRDCDLEVFVLARLATAEEVERPAGRDVPRRVEIPEPLWAATAGCHASQSFTSGTNAS